MGAYLKTENYKILVIVYRKIKDFNFLRTKNHG
jgi:hypothetical protein